MPFHSSSKYSQMFDLVHITHSHNSPPLPKMIKTPKTTYTPPFPANSSNKDILVLKPPSWRECFLGATWPVEPDHCHFCVQLPHISLQSNYSHDNNVVVFKFSFWKIMTHSSCQCAGMINISCLTCKAFGWGVWQTCLMKKYKWEVLYSLTHSIFQHLVEKSMMNRPPLALSDRWCRGQFVLETLPEISHTHPTKPNPTQPNPTKPNQTKPNQLSQQCWTASAKGFRRYFLDLWRKALTSMHTLLSGSWIWFCLASFKIELRRRIRLTWFVFIQIWRCCRSFPGCLYSWRGNYLHFEKLLKTKKHNFPNWKIHSPTFQQWSKSKQTFKKTNKQTLQNHR